MTVTSKKALILIATAAYLTLAAMPAQAGLQMTIIVVGTPPGGPTTIVAPQPTSTKSRVGG